MVPKLFGTTSSHSWISMLLKSPLPDSSHNLDPDPTINQSIDQYLFVAKKSIHTEINIHESIQVERGGGLGELSLLFFSACLDPLSTGRLWNKGQIDPDQVIIWIRIRQKKVWIRIHNTKTYLWMAPLSTGRLARLWNTDRFLEKRKLVICNLKDKLWTQLKALLNSDFKRLGK